jgi:hypothetical protein
MAEGGASFTGLSLANLGTTVQPLSMRELMRSGEYDGPHEALLREVWRSGTWVMYYEQALKDVTHDDMADGVVMFARIKTSGAFKSADADNPDVKRLSRIGALRTLYDDERKHMIRVCATACQVGIEERLVRLAEEQARQVGIALYTVIRQLGSKFGFDAEDPEVRELARSTLVELSESVA